MLPPGSVAGLTALLAAVPSVHAMYTSNSPVLQVNAKTYHTLIAKSNHTSVRCSPSPPMAFAVARVNPVSPLV